MEKKQAKDFTQAQANEIILYQPDDTLALDVRVEDDSDADG